MKIIVFVLWLIASLYLCIGGIFYISVRQKFEEAKDLPECKVYDKDSEYRNIDEMKAEREYRKMLSFYPFYKTAGSIICFVITLMAFGIFGSLIKILLMITLDKTSLADINVYTMPLLGGLIGILTFVLFELFPEFKNKSGNDKLFFSIALLGGIFTREFFNKVELIFKKFLYTSSEDTDKNPNDK